jgi:hypothetical protein
MLSLVSSWTANKEAFLTLSNTPEVWNTTINISTNVYAALSLSLSVIAVFFLTPS